MTDAHARAIDAAEKTVRRLMIESPGLSRTRLLELVMNDEVVSRPEVVEALVHQSLTHAAERVLEIIDVIEEFKVAGRELDPEEIAEDIVERHIEGLNDVSGEDRDFFLYYARREIAEEVSYHLAAEVEA